MKLAVSVDGRLVPPAEASVSVLDRGFLYGDAVFEVLRTYGRVPFALERHLERLAESARRALMALPVSLAELRREVETAISAANQRESLVRLMLTRGRAETLGLDLELAGAPLRVVLVMELAEPPAELYEAGIGAITFPTERVGDGTRAAGAKLVNYLVAVLALDEAKRKGAKEALVLDARGNVTEGCTSNVFVVRDGALVTPPESAGILRGITRDTLLELASRASLSVEERELRRDELFSADEAFISSSIREVVPVVSVDGHAIANGRPGPVTLRLLAEYRRFTRVA